MDTISERHIHFLSGHALGDLRKMRNDRHKFELRRGKVLEGQ